MMRSLVCVATLGVVASSHAVQYLINSPATYLLTNGETPFFTIPVDLIAAGFVPGQTVLLQRLGSYNDFGGPIPNAYGLTGVFSSSNVILPWPILNRIPGAIDAGNDWTSLPTFIGNVPTDIPEDFEIDNMAGTMGPLLITIPAGAQYIWASAQDNFYT
ncbi:MAG TPA: hypothetical protein VK171_15945, partial [Fimbriimonas sp.]|nr:hypothetical protein [Fimbriimonas sp.]